MITLTLPWPDRRLSPNARLDRRQVAGIKAREKEAARILTIEKYFVGYLADVKVDQPVSIEFCPPDNIKRDRDNLLASLKSQLDGVAEALGIDDSRFEPITIRRGPVVKGGQVILEIGE